MSLNGWKARIGGIVAAASLVASLAACGGPESMEPAKVIEKAVPAIQGANSFHFTLSTSKIQKAPPGIFITGVDGDVLKPDKLTGSVTATYSGIPVKINVLVDGKSQFWTDPASGRWAAMPTELNMAEFFDPSKGLADIVGGVKNLTGDGTENVEGTDTYRLKGSVPAQALKSLSAEVTATGDLTTTLWVGSGDFLIRKVTLQGPVLSDEPADIVRTITMKDYNKEVKIETPVVSK